MVRTSYEMIFTNDIRNQRVKIKNILDYLRSEFRNITDDDLYDLRVIYTELLTNAIVHGNKFDISKRIELFIELDSNLLKSTIKDEGDGFDYAKIIMKPLCTSVGSLNEHGRGLKLVFGLADFVEWNNIGNEVRFIKRIHFA